jgi:hypothetical protein
VPREDRVSGVGDAVEAVSVAADAAGHPRRQICVPNRHLAPVLRGIYGLGAVGVEAGPQSSHPAGERIGQFAQPLRRTVPTRSRLPVEVVGLDFGDELLD